jgi:hypothetical protein
MTTPASRVLTALLLAGAVVGSSTACGTAQPAGPSASPSASATASPTPAPSGSPTSTPSPGSTPVSIDCATLLSPEALYEINPNYSERTDYAPAPGSYAEQQAGDGGLACGWINQTSGRTLEVSVASPSEARLTELENTFVTESTAVPTFGNPPVKGYFEMNGDIGEAQVFSGPYWLTAVSADFFEPGDAAPVVAAALAGLGQ